MICSECRNFSCTDCFEDDVQLCKSCIDDKKDDCVAILMKLKNTESELARAKKIIKKLKAKLDVEKNV